MTSPSNAPEWSVSDLSGALKRTLEDAFGYVRLRGEISGYRGPHSSGHCYFCIKDEGAKLDAVIWKGVFGRLKTKPQEGLEVIVTGKITTFPGKSSYQIIVDSVEPAGLGALMAMIEERRRRLTAEGLFDEARKQLLPFLPRVIGVVTSPTGAVIRDILHRVADRFPCHVIVWPVRVQGETSAAEVASAIHGFNALPEAGPIPRPDVLIVARGGGSLEDLMSFNDEAVVRAAADSMIPLVAAVGHETDWTLIDLAADRRAPTPTGAAEMVVPVRADLLAHVDTLSLRQREAMRRRIERTRTDLRQAGRLLARDGEALLAGPRQRLDRASDRLGPALARNARVHETKLADLARRLARFSPQSRLAQMRAKLDTLEQRLASRRREAMAQRRDRLAALGSRLTGARASVVTRRRQEIVEARRRLAELSSRAGSAAQAGIVRRRGEVASVFRLVASLSPQAVLERGFVLVQDDAGHILRRAVDLSAGQGVTLRFADDTARAVVGDSPARPKKTSAPKGPGGQGSLF